MTKPGPIPPKAWYSTSHITNPASGRSKFLKCHLYGGCYKTCMAGSALRRRQYSTGATSFRRIRSAGRTILNSLKTPLQLRRGDLTPFRAWYSGIPRIVSASTPPRARCAVWYPPVAFISISFRSVPSTPTGAFIWATVGVDFLIADETLLKGDAAQQCQPSAAAC